MTAFPTRRSAYLLESGGSAVAFIGQSYRFTENHDVFAEGSGLEDKLAALVGRVQVRPTDDLDLLYRFRLDKDDLTPRRIELLLDVGPPALNLNLSYFFIKDDTIGDEFGDREEASFGIRSRLNENWSIRFQHRRDLIEDRALRTAISLGYQDECFLIEAVAQRTNYRDRELEEDDSIFRSEEHTSELQSLMRNSYAVFCLNKKNQTTII